MKSFQFKSDDVFYLRARGFVFHGIILHGEINNNDEVIIITKKGNLHANDTAGICSNCHSCGSYRMVQWQQL